MTDLLSHETLTEIEEALRPPPNKKRRTFLVPLMLLVVAMLYVLVPTVAEVLMSREVVPRELTAAPAFSAVQQQKITAFAQRWETAGTAAGPLILTYHDIAVQSSSGYTVTPVQFAQHMSALAAMGASTISAAEFRAYLDGGTLPPKAVLITFDDGTRGIWRYADRILEQHGFRATAFVITGFVGTNAPYYVTWDEIDELYQSGRWDVEAHAHLGHVKIETDASGGTGSFLAARRWDDAAGVETYEQFQQRVATDLAEAERQLKQRGYGKNDIFSFPFSDAGSHNEDATIAPLVLETALKEYAVVFHDTPSVVPTGGPTSFVRHTILQTTGTDMFVEDLDAILTANLQGQ